MSSSSVFAIESGTQHSAPGYLNMIASLVMVLALIFLLAFVAKKLRIGPANQQDIRLVANLTLGTKEKIVVIEVQNQQYLLGVTAQQINLLQKLPENITQSELAQKKQDKQGNAVPFDILSFLNKGKS